MIGIYKITSPTKKVYIGQSRNIKKRFRYYSKLNCRKQTILYRSFIKHGVDNHKFEVICECPLGELNDKERYYQELYNCVKTGLNCELVNDSNSPEKRSLETGLKISVARKGMVFTQAHRQNIRISKTGANNKRSKIVIDLSTGIFYDTIAEAGYTYGIDSRTLSRYLNGTRTNKTSLATV